MGNVIVYVNLATPVNHKLIGAFYLCALSKNLQDGCNRNGIAQSVAVILYYCCQGKLIHFCQTIKDGKK